VENFLILAIHLLFSQLQTGEWCW